MDLHLEGKVIFVTGGFKGIGKSIPCSSPARVPSPWS